MYREIFHYKEVKEVWVRYTGEDEECKEATRERVVGKSSSRRGGQRNKPRKGGRDKAKAKTCC